MSWESVKNNTGSILNFFSTFAPCGLKKICERADQSRAHSSGLRHICAELSSAGVYAVLLAKGNILEAEWMHPGVKLLCFDLGSNIADQHISLYKLLGFRAYSKLSQILQSSAASWHVYHPRAAQGVATPEVQPWSPCKTSREESLLCTRAKTLFPGCY